MMAASRLTLRLERFEIIALGLLVTALVATAIWETAQLAGLRPPLECLTDSPPEPPACAEAEAFFAQAQIGNWLLTALLAAPFVLGLLLGASLGSREIEHGWAQLTWSLDGRSGRWFVRRFLVLAAVVVVLGALLGVAGQALESEMSPRWDAAASFHNFGARGIPTLMRAVAAFSLAVLVGVLLGRVLPSIIVAGGLCVALWVLVTTQTAFWVSTTYEPVPAVDGSYRISGIAYQQAGSVFSPEEVAAQSPHRFQSRAYWVWLDENFELVSVVIAPDRYVEAVAGEAAALVGGSALAFGMAAVVVRRRRPTT
jgi:hypothetical protein